MTSVLVTDVRQAVRESLAAGLEAAGIDVLGHVGEPGAALLQTQRLRPDVVLVPFDYEPGLLSLVPELRALDPRPRTLVVAAGGADADAEAQLITAIEAGADGFATGDGGIADLANSIVQIAEGQTVVPPQMLGTLLRQLIEARRAASQVFERLIELTPREREILLLIADGGDVESIAEHLVISTETARTHVQRVLRKLGVDSRVEAMVLIRQNDLITHLESVVERSAS